MAIEFWVELRGAEYNINTGWPCHALDLPGAKPTRIVVAGLDKSLNEFTVAARAIKFSGAPPKEVPDAAALITIDRRLVSVDTAILVAIIGAIGTIVAAWLSHGPSAAHVDPPPCPSADQAAATKPEVTATAVPPALLPPGPGDARPSLMSAFLAASPQGFAGDGTIGPPTCRFSGGKLAIEIPGKYQGYAGCYLELSAPTDLTSFLNGVVKVRLSHDTDGLEIKLESGTAGDGRGEKFIVRQEASAGAHEYPVSSVPKEVIEHALRLTFALREKPPKANAIVVQP